MKPLSYSLIAAALACGFASAQTTAYTTPVGYVTLQIPGLTAGKPSDTTVGQPLIREVAYQGSATAVTGGIITVASGGMTVDQFKYAPPQTNHYYVQVVGGALDGRCFDVFSNTATTITVDNGTTDIAAVVGSTVKVIPFWTLGTLFPNGGGFSHNPDDLDDEGLVMFRNPDDIGANRPPVSAFKYYTGTAGNGPGWYRAGNDANSAKEDNTTIDQSMLALIRNPNAPVGLVITGTVPMSNVATPILSQAGKPNDNYLGQQFPLDTTLVQSGLASVMKPGDEFGDGGDVLFTYSDEASGANKAPTGAYFVYSGQWYDFLTTQPVVVDTGILKAGRGYIVRRDSGNPTGTVNAISVPSYPH